MQSVVETKETLYKRQEKHDQNRKKDTSKDEINCVEYLLIDEVAVKHIWPLFTTYSHQKVNCAMADRVHLQNLSIRILFLAPRHSA
jgi:hypothetical protein